MAIGTEDVCSDDGSDSKGVREQILVVIHTLE